MEKIENILMDALDTFKAFDNLTIDTSGLNQEEFPSSIWQILNHLVLWQESQLDLMKGITPEKDISETDTWLKERIPPNEVVLQRTVDTFKAQLNAIKAEIESLPIENNLAKFKILQEVSLHLSFHLGEVVLIRRLKGSYPLPHQMKEFLTK